MEEAMQMSDAEFGAWMDERVNLEFDSSTAIAWQSAARLSKIGFDFALGQSTAAGENAAIYWAQRQHDTGNLLYAFPGVAASLWTPDTYFDTTMTLGGGLLAGRAGQFLGPRGPIFGDTAFGATHQGILNQGRFRAGFGRHNGAQFRIGVGNRKLDIGRPIKVKRPPDG